MSRATEQIRATRDLLLSFHGRIDEACAAFTWPDITGPFNWAIDWFDAVGRGNDRIALWIRETDGSEARYTYDDMVRRSDAVAGWLDTLGIGKGDTVMLMLGNQIELWDAMLAVMKVGGIILPTAEAITSEDLADRVVRADVRAVITNPADTDKFSTVAGEYVRIVAGAGQDGWIAFDDAYAHPAEPREVITDADDPVLEYFTSGTTKAPKLVQHTQLSYPVGHLTTTYFIGVRPGDVHLNISAPGWGKHAWSSFFAPWIAEATIFVYNYQRFDAADLMEQLRRVDVATFCAPPTVWRMMIQADLGERPASLREVVGAGEPLNPEVINQVRNAWGLTIRDGYGQTESTATVGNVPGERVKAGSMGKPLPGVPIEIVDPETGQPADLGEICLRMDPRPLNLMSGYHGMPELDAAAIHGGYYHTGDLVSRDADGYITYVGRTDDVFKASDYKISPFELESVLMEHPAVQEAAVVPAPDAVRLAVPKAYITLAPGIEHSRETALSILSHAKDHLAPYLRVRRIEFGELPKTISGKIRRVVLRAQEHDRAKATDPAVREAGEYRYEDFPELRTRQ
ncbi:acetyl-CoA synthetase [Raineyella antarctica]|uniref:Acetyl-CoA synthetase n=1 Tax=Raineyella antarctica TaxID=1577474 RepID=A0A1G6GLP2_9ACTN|nr:AMP-binding protein [Raineyella antarctica]SDB82897.1 acetyl-CoA synthetase [Raineyella antarctica]